MKRLSCPLNGPRNINEFQYGGEVLEPPDATTASDAEWSRHVFLRRNARGVVAEWWCHVPSSVWFVAERDTGTDEVIGTWRYEEWLRRKGDAG